MLVPVSTYSITVLRCSRALRDSGTAGMSASDVQHFAVCEAACRMHGRMDGWMHGWMHGCMTCIHERMPRRMYVCMHGCMCVYMSRLMHVCSWIWVSLSVRVSVYPSVCLSIAQSTHTHTLTHRYTKTFDICIQDAASCTPSPLLIRTCFSRRRLRTMPSLSRLKAQGCCGING